jgi:hypothetical protein
MPDGAGGPAERRVWAADIVAAGQWTAVPGGSVPYFTKAQLGAANREAEEMNYYRRIERGALARLPAGAKFPVALALPHTRGAEDEGDGPQIRCRVILDQKGDAVFLDITPQRFDRLPWSG